MKTRAKGYRSEHELEQTLNANGIMAERITLSGQHAHTGDITIGIGERVYTGEVKALGIKFREYEWLNNLNVDMVFKRCVVPSRPAKPFLVVMYLDTFVNLVKRLRYNGGYTHGRSV